MSETQYTALLKFCRDTPSRERALFLICKLSPFVMFLIYASTALRLILLQDPRILQFLLVPLSGLAVVSLLRNHVNLPRPYEQFKFTPLLPAKSVGHSFPSRHTTSAFLTAMSLLWLSVSFGIYALCLASLIGVSRVLSGMHFPRDVLAGMTFAVVWCCIGFWII